MFEVEQNILGAILMDNEALDKIYDTIRPEMFEHTLYQDTFREMLAMYDKGETIDYLSLAQRLQGVDRSEEFVKEQLHEITKATFEETFTTTKITGYADVLIKDWQSREAKNVIDHVDFSPNNILNAIADVMSRFEALQQNKKSTFKSLKQIVEEYKDNYFKEKVGKDRLKIGFDEFDELTGGLEKGDVSIIAARPACGKSAFATQIVENMALQGLKVGYFNLEMREDQIYERLVSHRLTHKDGLARLRNSKQFLGGEEQEFSKINEILSKLPVTVISDCYTVGAIRKHCRHQNYDVIVIDYLQLVESGKKFNSRAEEVGAVSRALKKLAMELNVHIIVLSQLNRASEGRQDKEPTMAELRESGAIEQDASIIILLWNMNNDVDCKYKGGKVEKARQGMTGKVPLIFDGAHMVFYIAVDKDGKTVSFAEFKKHAKEDSGFSGVTDDIADMF